MAKLIILEPAQRELEEIALLHLNLVGQFGPKDNKSHSGHAVSS